MSNFKAVAKNTLFQSLGKIVTLFLSIAATSLLARSLGPTGYGDYTFITAFVLLFGTVADWGTNIIAVREASSFKDKQKTIFGNIILFRFVIAIVALLILNLVVLFNNSWQTLAIPIFVGSFVLLALSFKTSLGVVFQTLLRFDLSSIVEIISSVLFLSFVFLVIYLNLGLPGVMAAWVFSTLMASIASFAMALNISGFHWQVNLPQIKRILIEAFPAGALFIMFTVYNRIDTIILQHFLGSSAVGIYGLSYKIHDNLVLGAAFLMNALFPILARNFSDSSKHLLLKKQYQKTFDLLLLLGVFVFIVVYFIAPFIVTFLGGPEFSPSITILRILLFATLIAYFNHLTGYSLIAFGKQRQSLIIATGALVFNVTANLLLVPVYSYKASAIITVATEAIVLVLSSIVVAKTIGVYPSLFSFPKTFVGLIKNRTVDF